MTRAALILGKTYDEILDGYTLAQLKLLVEARLAEAAAVDARALLIAATAQSGADAVKKLHRTLLREADQ